MEKYPRSKLQSPGRGGGLVVSILAFYSDDLSLHVGGDMIFFVRKDKNIQKEVGVGPSFLKLLTPSYYLLLDPSQPKRTPGLGRI